MTTGDRTNVSIGVYSDYPDSKPLDTLWDEHTFDLFINDRPVDLAAFGSIDVMHPRIGPMRFHDIAIEVEKPARSSFVGMA